MLKIHGDTFIVYYVQLNAHLFMAPSSSDVLPKEFAHYCLFTTLKNWDGL